MNEKEKIYCCDCCEEAEYKYHDEEYCYECLCELLKEEIIEKFNVSEIIR